MIRDVWIRVLAFLLGLTSVACPAAAAEVDSGGEYCFASEEFSGEENLRGICIRWIPENAGVLELEGRILRPGDVLTAEQVDRMIFRASEAETDRILEVGYLPVYEDRVAEDTEMTLSLRGREDKAPVAEDSALETYRNLPNTGKLKAEDPEGKPLTFAVVRQPRRGTLEIGEDGSFTYTPKKNKVGVDSFTYTASDPAGKTSREATVTVTILKPSDGARYTDTLGQDCRFAAEWMRHTGIFAGETVAQEPCFSPGRQVTRGEFVTMLVKALDIPRMEEVTVTGYEEVPVWLQPYLAAAVRAGLTAGLEVRETFGQDQIITGTEAAVMLENALDDADAFSGLTEEPLTRAEVAQVLYDAVKLRESRRIDTVV